jgi:hypothetical protein
MNDTATITMTPKCMKCGHVGIVIPDNPIDDSILVCEGCGAELGTHGQLQAKIRETAIDAAGDMLKKALKDALGGSSHIKLNF